MRMTSTQDLAWVLGADLAGGDLAGGDVAVGPDVVIDSRRATPGALFVALSGEHTDGHRFAGAARDLGAAAVLGTRPCPELPTLVVPDAAAALGLLARHLVLAEPALTVLGITGSSGKTSTKDLLAQVLELGGPTIAPEGSFNNEIGVPLTATRVDAGTRFLVSEMGARGQGHITYLCGLTPPTIGVVLNVGRAHVGEFGDQEATARAKGELVAALPPDGFAVLNAEDHRVAGMAARTRAQLVWFGFDEPPQPGRHVYTQDLTHDELGRHRFTLVADDERAEVSLTGSGRHQVANALAAAAACRAAGLDLATIARGLSSAGRRSRWRMEIDEAPGGYTVVNDSYNANPDSMRAALTTVAEIAHTRGSRAHAVLGDMLELGAGSTAAHRELGELAADLGFESLVAYGEHASDICAGFGEAGTERRAGATPPARPATVADSKEAIAGVVRAALAPGDVVVVKASRGLALESVAADLLGAPGSDEKNGHDKKNAHDEKNGRDEKNGETR